MTTFRGALQALIAAGLVLAAGCGSGGGSFSNSGSSLGSGNVLPLSVNLGPTGGYVNGLFASITLCVPGTSNCQVIDDVLVDTGSYGLRVLASATTLSLPAQTNAGGATIAECAAFVDGYVWGPVVTADVKLAGEMAALVPIQVIGATSLPAAPSGCAQGIDINSVQTLGANGVLGIGPLVYDCDSGCATNISNGTYFACSTSSCVGSRESLANQVQNPVPLLSSDNNGVVVELPAIGATGAASVSGSLLFGIGTQSNNAMGTATVLGTDTLGEVATTITGIASYPASFFDTGSNAFFFSSTMPLCTNASDFYCPTSTQNFSGRISGHNGNSAAVTFSVANAENLFGGNVAFNNLAGTTAGSSIANDFDWGLPFFFGRNVFVAIENQSTSGGTGPYYAF